MKSLNLTLALSVIPTLLFGAAGGISGGSSGGGGINGGSGGSSGTNFNSIRVTNNLTIGSGSNSYTFSATNSATFNGMPFVLWNSYNEYNTNVVLITNSPQATFNQGFTWNSVMNVYTGMTTISRVISNYPSSGLWGLGLNLGQANPSQQSTNLFSTNWSNGSGTNIITSSWFQTNTCWRIPTIGQKTNWTQWSDGEGGTFYSNGASFKAVTRRGATNRTVALDQAEP